MFKKSLYLKIDGLVEMIKKKSETDTATNCVDDLKLINCLIDMLVDVDYKCLSYFELVCKIVR